jgi:hypothetical protein
MAGAAALLVCAKAVVLVAAMPVNIGSNKGSANAIEQLRAMRNMWFCKRRETWGRALKRVMIWGLISSNKDYKRMQRCNFGTRFEIFPHF